MKHGIFGVTHRAVHIASLLAACFVWLAGTARAGDGKESKAVAAPEPRFKIYGWIETGFTLNPDDPKDRQNFGRLFDDRSNEFLLNQAVLTLERTLPAGLKTFDWGFKLQGMVGSDARVIHSLGLLDNSVHEIIEPDLVEAFFILHFPIFSPGGLDLRVGKFVTLEGNETIDPRANFFYSHTFLFNFGIPLNHTGALLIYHATPQLDLYGGVTRGVNTSIDDNNDSAAFHGGLGLTLCDGNFTLFASTHIGPETPFNDDDLRYLNDVTFTIKATKKITLITDLNYIYDEAANAGGYGIAQQFLYAFNDIVSLGVRGEIWRDDKGFYATSFAENDDVADLLRGGKVTIDPRTVGGGKTT
jgi:hypothetical protein